MLCVLCCPVVLQYVFLEVIPHTLDEYVAVYY